MAVDGWRQIHWLYTTKKAEAEILQGIQYDAHRKTQTYND